MLTTSRRRWSICALVLFLFGALTVVVYAGHSWANYHWARTSNPLTLKLGNNTTGPWPAHLSIASSDWTQSTVMDTTIVAGGTGGARRCPATLGRVEVCNAKYGQNGWLGIASIWANGDHITQGTAKMNDTYFNMAQYNTPAWRQFVMCQEVGHTFGLDHQDEVFGNYNLGTCMDYTNAPAGGIVNGFNYGPSNEHPNTHDYDQLVTIYTHLDTTNTSFQTVGHGAAAGNDSSEWGRLVRTTNNGRTSLFERDLGNGNKMFTFVIWADKAEAGE
ncbi:MAG: hypothetical protein ACR2HX_16860 [Pyrinomonadaceae bacterium]